MSNTITMPTPGSRYANASGVTNALNQQRITISGRDQLPPSPPWTQQLTGVGENNTPMGESIALPMNLEPWYEVTFEYQDRNTGEWMPSNPGSPVLVATVPHEIWICGSEDESDGDYNDSIITIQP